MAYGNHVKSQKEGGDHHVKWGGKEAPKAKIASSGQITSAIFYIAKV